MVKFERIVKKRTAEAVWWLVVASKLRALERAGYVVIHRGRYRNRYELQMCKSCTPRPL